MITSRTAVFAAALLLVLAMTNSAGALIAKSSNMTTETKTAQVPISAAKSAVEKALVPKDVPAEAFTTETIKNISEAEKAPDEKTMPSWLNPEQKKQLREMQPEEASKALIEWTKKEIEQRNKLDEQDKAVKRMIEKSKLTRSKKNTPKPIFTKKEREKITKMNDREREEFLAKKGIHVRINRENTTETLMKPDTETSSTFTGSPLFNDYFSSSTAENMTSVTLESDDNVLSVTNPKTGVTIKVRKGTRRLPPFELQK